MHESGALLFDWIADNTRWMRKPVSFDSIDEAPADVAAIYRRALWSSSSVLVEVWCESDSTANTTDEWDVPLMVTRGYLGGGAAQVAVFARAPALLTHSIRPPTTTAPAPAKTSHKPTPTDATAPAAAPCDSISLIRSRTSTKSKSPTPSAPSPTSVTPTAVSFGRPRPLNSGQLRTMAMTANATVNHPSEPSVPDFVTVPTNAAVSLIHGKNEPIRTTAAPAMTTTIDGRSDTFGDVVAEATGGYHFPSVPIHQPEPPPAGAGTGCG